MEHSPLFDVPNLSQDEIETACVRYLCVDCGILSPRAKTSHTLISARFGWRLHRSTNAETGAYEMQWRCPDCWQGFRQRPQQTQDELAPQSQIKKRNSTFE